MSVGRDRGLRPWVKGLRAKGDIATFEIPPPFTHCLKGRICSTCSNTMMGFSAGGCGAGSMAKHRISRYEATWSERWRTVQEEARVTCRLEMVPTPMPFTFLGVERVCGLVVISGLLVGGESGSRWGVVERAGRRSPSTSRVHRHQGCIDDEPATLRAHRRHGYIDATGASTKSLRCHGAHRRRGCIDDEPHNVAAASTLGCIAMTPRCHWYFDDDGTAAGASTTTPRRHGLNDDGDAATAGALMMIQQRWLMF
ncbi:hypothetical protein BDZ97DRAFT_1757518 [Flammula alnicola]|nr:hypothetical protein BDZ97DRAFT_1757518 [Flammula alnicola]